ncbi:MAG TPA: hypothetical protein VII58_03415 [Acidobacteriaceae bacterium]
MTVETKERDAPWVTTAYGGEMVMHRDGAVHGVTETVASASTLGSAALVAITWNVPTVLGAVYTPELAIDPPDAPSPTDHVTAELVVPFTLATKESDPRCATVTTDGEIATDTEGEEDEEEAEGSAGFKRFPQAVRSDMPSKSENCNTSLEWFRSDELMASLRIRSRSTLALRLARVPLYPVR